MRRRHFIHLATTGLVGCSNSRKPGDVFLKAGPFAVTVPEYWSKAAIVEKMPIHVLYSPEEWVRYQEDQSFVLKPSYHCRPQHWALRFPNALPKGISFDRENSLGDPTSPQILIHKADEWGVVATDGRHEKIKVADVVSNLRKNMDAAMLDANLIDSPAIIDGSPTFNSLMQRINFTGGYGIRLITQWTIEPALMELGQLHYLFLGMSDDNSCQIIATFPIDLPGLPKPEDKIHLGHSIESYNEFTQNYQKYVADAEKWLEKNENQIAPSLSDLDQVMQSLVVSRWE